MSQRSHAKIPWATTDEPTPEGDPETDIARLVQADLEARARTGKKTYGERLRPHNGRRALVDAYQEVLDTAMYLRQEIVERYGVDLDPR